MVSCIKCLYVTNSRNVNNPGYIGRTPIQETAARGYLKTTQLLIANKADHEQPSRYFKNATPVVVAVMCGQLETVQYFIKVSLFWFKVASYTVDISQLNQPIITKLLDINQSTVSNTHAKL